MAQPSGSFALITREVGPGVRLHLIRTDRFATTLCRVVLHRDLGPEATATSLLAQVLQSSTARHPTRRALALALADLYGATLHVAVGKLGDRQILSGTQEWPTAHVPRSERQLVRGLELLREVLTEPLRQGPRGAQATRIGAPLPLDPDVVRTEQVNLERTLRALEDDKHRLATARCIGAVCRDEPFGLEPLGRLDAIPSATPEALGDLHARLLATAPVDVFLVGDIGLRNAMTAVRRHLLWGGRSARRSRVPPACAVRAPRKRPQRIVETDQVQQGKLVLAWRAPVRATSPLLPAAATIAGVLGGGSFGRLFKIVREERGLCYYADALWSPPKGLMVAHVGIDPAQEPFARRLVQRIARDVAAGVLDESSLSAYREAVASRMATLSDDRSALLGWLQACLTLGRDPVPARWVDAVRKVTPAAVRRVGRMLGLDTTFYLEPRGTRESGVR